MLDHNMLNPFVYLCHPTESVPTSTHIQFGVPVQQMFAASVTRDQTVRLWTCLVRLASLVQPDSYYNEQISQLQALGTQQSPIENSVSGLLNTIAQHEKSLGSGDDITQSAEWQLVTTGFQEASCLPKVFETILKQSGTDQEDKEAIHALRMVGSKLSNMIDNTNQLNPQRLLQVIGTVVTGFGKATGTELPNVQDIMQKIGPLFNSIEKRE